MCIMIFWTNIITDTYEQIYKQKIKQTTKQQNSNK